MVVNVASRCGYTPQYSALETIYEKYKDRGFVIVGVPANNFGAQEPGTERRDQDVLHAQVQRAVSHDVEGVSEGLRHRAPLPVPDRSALHPKTGGEIKWNFTKFLVDRKGNIVARFEPDVTPDSPQVVSGDRKSSGSVGPSRNVLSNSSADPKPEQLTTEDTVPHEGSLRLLCPEVKLLLGFINAPSGAPISLQC